VEVASHISDYLDRSGACLSGFACMSQLAAGVAASHPFAVSFAIPLDREVVRGLSGGPTHLYLEEYRRANSLLDSISEGLVHLIEAGGFCAESISATTSEFDVDTLSSRLPHKTAATLAGLGWIGKCALLITRGYGSAVRLGTVVTDADLPSGDPVTSSHCGSCTLCVDACPGAAPTGSDWVPGMPRDDLFDAHACQEAARKLSRERIGGARTICGICISVCPWTRRYIGIP
jgi:epoxyqueuosine reductase